MKVFVYGTLRQGFHNHDHFMKDAEFVGFAKTVFGAKLYGEGVVPFLKFDTVGSVYGEVYEVNDSTRERLDRLEGHPTTYRRTEGLFRMLGSWERVTAEFYFYQHGVSGHFFYNYEREQIMRGHPPDGGPRMKYSDYCGEVIDRVCYIVPIGRMCPYCFNETRRHKAGIWDFRIEQRGANQAFFEGKRVIPLEAR